MVRRTFTNARQTTMSFPCLNFGMLPPHCLLTKRCVCVDPIHLIKTPSTSQYVSHLTGHNGGKETSLLWGMGLGNLNLRYIYIWFDEVSKLYVFFSIHSLRRMGIGWHRIDQGGPSKQKESEGPVRRIASDSTRRSGTPAVGWASDGVGQIRVDPPNKRNARGQCIGQRRIGFLSFFRKANKYNMKK